MQLNVKLEFNIIIFVVFVNAQNLVLSQLISSSRCMQMIKYYIINYYYALLHTVRFGCFGLWKIYIEVSGVIRTDLVRLGLGNGPKFFLFLSNSIINK